MKPDPRAPTPARRLLTRGKIQKATFLSGRKVTGVVATEVGLEAIAAKGAELDPRVRSWRPQPFTIDLDSGETAGTKTALIERHRGTGYRPKPYTPDHLFTMTCGEHVVIECKHTCWIEENVRKVDEILTVLPRLGFRIVLLTQLDLWGPYEHNVQLLAPYLRYHVADLDRLIRFCQVPRHFQEILESLCVPKRDLLTAIAQGHLSCNLRLQRIMPETLVQVPYGPSWIWVPNL